VANHRPHLGPWVELTIGRSQDKAGRLVRQASTFRLIEWIRLTPVIRPIREGGDLFDRKAVDLLEQVEYLRSEHLQDLRLRSLVARALREGMPFQSLLERLTTNVPPVHRIVSGPDFLEARVPASGAEVPISARLAVELDARTKRAAIPRPTPVAVAETVPVASRRAALQRWCEGRDGRCHAPIPDDTWGNLCRACAHELSRIGA
jgi:hypothetical protein